MRLTAGSAAQSNRPTARTSHVLPPNSAHPHHHCCADRLSPQMRLLRRSATAPLAAQLGCGRTSQRPLELEDRLLPRPHPPMSSGLPRMLLRCRGGSDQAAAAADALSSGLVEMLARMSSISRRSTSSSRRVGTLACGYPLSPTDHRPYGVTYSDLRQRFVPDAALDAFSARSPIKDGQLIELARGFVPTRPFHAGGLT